ncbi:sugar-binding protein [Paenibacillus oryzisoli]|uniref:sugar-binding protein n=1 Tax=Paenibacillus oryzisoli TaxID=1850517 RepID=UPI003D2DB8BF
MNVVKKVHLWLLMLALVGTAVMAPVIPAVKAYAAGETKYEAETAAAVDASVQTVTGAVYSGTGYRDLGSKANGASVTWTTVQAATYGNYILTVKYSNTDADAKPINLIVNGQEVAKFAGSPTGQGPLPIWGSLTAVVILNQGNNTVKVTSESADGPLVDDLEVTSFATIIEAENGGGAAHVGASVAANVGTAPGFSGSGYVSLQPSPTSYLLYTNVVVPQTGQYTIKVRYSLLSGSRPYAVTVNGTRVQDAKGVSSGSWANWSYEELTGITFNAGVNTLKIERIGANATPVIDRFEIVSEAPMELGDQTFRTTTFETSDVDPVIAGTATGAATNSPLILGSALKSTAASTVKLVQEAGSRWAEVTSPAAKQGIVGFPFHASWLAPVPMKTYTLESSFMLKDDKANYIFKLISAAGLESSVFVFGMDNQIYARSANTPVGALAARAPWSLNTVYKVKLVFHVDTKSYDMYVNDVKLVDSEPLENNAYLGGLKGFYLEAKDGARQESKILVDDIQMSGSSAAGTAPVVNPNPGSIFDEQPYIGNPVVYYVSPSGLDTNDGKSTATPFKTITKAVSVTNPGDTVNLMPGTYSPTNDVGDFVLINRSGAKDVHTGELHYITYKAYDPDNKPKLLLPNNIKGVWDMVDVSANYIIIDGLEVEGNNMNLTVADGEANYNSKVAGGSDWSNYAKTNTNGINVQGHHIVVRNSHVHHLSGGGVNVGGADYITVENNDIHSNAWFTFYGTSGISFLNDVDVDNNTTDYKMIVRNNLVYDNETKVKWEKNKGYTDGNGIIFDVDETYKGKKLVMNNIVFNNGGGGIHIYRSHNVHVINNTVFHNSRSPYLKYPNMDVQSGDNAIFLNNISVARDEDGEYANQSSGFNNLFANNLYSGLTRFLGKNDRVADPKFVSVTGAVYDFHLQADSPAIDNGTRTLLQDIDYDGQARPYAGAGSNTRVDIGAYETASNNPAFLADDSVQFIEPTPDVSKSATAAKGTPVIDGQIEDVWSTTEGFQALYLSDYTRPAPLATVRLLWGEHNLYVLAEVKDDNLNATGGNLWEHDSMEFFVDENDAKTTSFQSDDRHYRVNYLNLKSGGTNVTPDIFTSATSVVDGGYIIEAALPLTSITGAVGSIIGFDAGASDDSNYDGIRDNATMWSNRRINSNASTQWYGNVTFVAAPTIASLTPVTVNTTVGHAPTLPSVVQATYTSGAIASAAVVWEAIDSSRYASAGEFTVHGTVTGTDIQAVAHVVVATETPGGTTPGGTTPGGTTSGGTTSGGTTSSGTTPVIEGAVLKVTPTMAGTEATSEVTMETLQKLFAQTQANDAGVKQSTVNVKPAEGAKAYVQGLPAQLFAAGTGTNKLVIQTALATVTVPDNMLKGKDLAGASKIELRIAQADTSGWKQELKDKIGSKPVLDLAMMTDGKRIEWKNNQAPVTVAIPYQPTAEELKKPEHIAIWYVDGAGKIIKIPSGKYNAETGTITFTATHFSQYAVGFEVKSFSDLGNFAWAKDAIEVLVSKGIVNGTTESTYAPGERITRADFLALLVRTLGLEKDVQSNFEDVKSTDYFFTEIGIAKALGITDGIGGNQFQPKQPITRQDMMVLTARAMKLAGKALPAATAHNFAAFSDRGSVSDYAASSVAALVQGGLVQGSGAMLAPQAAASRAEVAVLMYRLYNR